MKERYGFIYITINLINGKKYIGQRKINQKDTKYYLGSGKALKKAIEKYGRESFKREIIEYAYSEKELNDLEDYYLALTRAYEDDSYYNIARYCNVKDVRNILNAEEYEIYRKKLSEGVRESYNKNPNLRKLRSQNNYKRKEAIKIRNMTEKEYLGWLRKEKDIRKSKIRIKNIWKNNIHPQLGKPRSEYTKNKISISLKKIYSIPENNPMYGKKHSEKSKEIMSYYAKEIRDNTVYRTKEFRSKMSDITSGDKNGMYGKKHSSASKKKMSENSKGKTSGNKNGMFGKKGENAINGKAIYMLNDNGVVIKEFVSVQCVLEYLGIKGHSALYRACRNNKKYKGYYWRKVE